MSQESTRSVLVRPLSNTVVPVAVAPSGRTSVTVTAADASATVSWLAPTSDSGSPVASYTFTAIATNWIGSSSPSGSLATVVPVGPTGQSVLPGRVLESRSGDPAVITVDGLFQGVGRTRAGEVREVKVTELLGRRLMLKQCF